MGLSSRLVTGQLMTGEKEKGQHVATHSRTLTLFSFVRRAFVFPIAMHVLYLKKNPPHNNTGNKT